jgi:glycosyltransferase involved in cell wall biosynthesis
MKICLNLLAATAGGQLSRARAFLDRFHRYAPNDELIVFKEKDVLSDCVSVPGRRVVDVPIGLGKTKAIRRMCWENVIMPMEARRHAADVYLTFSHYLPRNLAAMLPSVVGVSNLAPFSAEAWDSESLLIKMKMVALRRSIVSSCHRATHVLALSDTCLEVLVACGIPNEKISVTPNGVEMYWGQQLPATGDAAHLGINRPFILYVSHFHRYKNHSRLVEAYSRLQLSTRMAHQLVLVGKPYSLSCYEETRALIDHLNLADDVVLVPGLDWERLRDLYQLARLFVFPSLIENSPNILLEAMMAGAPVVASSLPPMPEFGGNAASYFDASDASSIAGTIEQFLGDSSALAGMRRRSREQALRFSWDSFVSAVTESCRSAVAQQRSIAVR